MKKRLLVGLLAGLLIFCMGGFAQATIVYDADISPDVIFGSGNSNGSFVSDSADNIEVGLRGKVAYAGVYNSNGAGTYTFLPGEHPAWGDPGASWNFEFSVNVDVDGTTGKTLGEYNITLSIDTDPGLGQSWTEFNPFDTFTDNALGSWDTLNGAGDDSATANSLWGNYSVGQNSMNIGWLGLPFDNSAKGTYDFKLAVSEVTGSPLVETFMTVEVVPEPGTMLLLGFGLLGLAGVSRKKNE